MQKKEKQALYDKFTTYREWLLHITIVDPACGSGAFLNRTLDFLIAEHNWIDHQQEKIAGLKGHYSMELSNIENTILENNLFGVDINDESVEIAKLSLWLRTAKPHRKLNSLNNNIKCGNSLIDDPAVAGEKAFDWHKEFPQIFQKKEKKAWHITTATHNSRYSQRMFDNYVKLGEPVWLTEEEELIITRTIAEIAVKDQLNILAYNICGDHMHIALVCEEDEVEKIVGKLKSVSARAANIATGRTIPATSRSQGHAPLSISEPTGETPVSLSRGETQSALWTQKFGCNEITSKEQLQNTIAYIRTNRKKHGLPELYNGKTRNDVDTTNKGTILGVEELSCDNKGACPLVIAPISETTVSDTLPVTDATLADSSVSAIPVIFSRTVSPEYAFRPEYKGGFDVVIGNPPYVKEATSKKAFNGLHKHPCYQGKMDLWYMFGWMSLDIVKENTGLIGFIAPNNWITNDGASNFRNKIINDSKLIEFIDFGDYKVFDSAGIQTMIFVLNRNKNNDKYNFQYSKITNKNITLNEVQAFLAKQVSENTEIYQASIIKEKFVNSIFNFPNIKNDIVLSKIEIKGNFYLQNNEINSGIDIGQDFVNNKSKFILGDNFNVGDGVFNLSNTEYNAYNFSNSEKSLLKPFYTTKEINRYLNINENNLWVIYTSSKFKNPKEILPYPKIKEHIDKYRQIITSDNKPYGLHRTRDEKIFKGEKILSIRKCIKPSFSYIEFDAYVNRTYNIIQSNRINLKYLLSLLNSKLISYWLKEKGKLQGEIFQVDINPLMSIPLIMVDVNDQQPFISKVDEMYSLNKEILEISGKFQRMLQRKFELEELPGKLQNWYTLSYKEFIAELGKKKVKLSLAQEAEWEEYFHAEQAKALEIKKQIDDTDREIDRMVYELYELTEEEVKIVEVE